MFQCSVEKMAETKLQRLISYFDILMYFLILPFQISFYYFASIMIPGGKKDWKCYIKNALFTVILLVVIVVTFPSAVMSFTYYCLLSLIFRRKKFHVTCNVPADFDLKYCKQGVITVTTTNVCGMPEFLSKYNSLPNVFRRLRNICDIICSASESKLSQSRELGTYTNSNLRELDICSENNGCSVRKKYDHATYFHNSDILCIQEVWDKLTSWYIVRKFRSVYPYIVYDVGEFHLTTNLCLLGSGLMIASRFPILDVDYKCFTNRTAHCRVTAMGVLAVKVLIHSGKSNSVGYVATTHLQSYPDEGKVKELHCLQLSEIQEFLKKFKSRKTESYNICGDQSEEKELIMFDFLAGDFNFDNMSPRDKHSSQHHLVTVEYTDPGRLGPGEDYEWTIGTELRHVSLYNEHFSSAELLKQALVDPILRRHCVMDADVEEQTFSLPKSLPKPDESNVIGYVKHGGKRRVDKIYYNKKRPMVVMKYCVTTALTNLTDHLPVSMTFSISDHQHVD
ncbi:Uncharacterised protein g5358 [Pycnogonum litorale]